ncbi:MAG: NAD-dependent epimerase/dehydratase family protein [Clostridia bacterium]|nr:NAD-dependent epimerase/dehydratase family protein [Clostridia bacterium]
MHNPFDNSIVSEDMKNIYDAYNKWERLYEKSVYISGATGMIASYLVLFFSYLNEMYDMRIEIYAGVRNLQKSKKIFGDLLDKNYFHIVEGDVVDIAVSPKLEWNYIIHAASLASPQYYGSMPVEVMLPNVIGTWRLLELAKNMSSESVLFFSSGDVYGKLDNIETVDENVVGVLDYLKNGNMYGESKRCGEALCMAYCSEYGISTKAARIHHTYGPTMNIDSDTRVFSEFVKNIVSGEDIVMKSDGAAMRAFCYVTDCVEAMLRILIEGDSGGMYNIGNPNEYISIKDLAITMSKISGFKAKVIVQERNAGKNYCPSTIKQRLNVSVEKLKRMGWRPKVGIEDGFTRVIKYFKISESL